VVARMCPQLTDSERARLNRFKYQGIICASLLLKEPLSDFYITNITENWAPYTAVIEMSALADRSNFGGRALVYLPKYLSAESADFDLTDEQVKERFLVGLERMYPAFKRENVVCFQVSRVKYLLPISTLRYSDDLPPVSTSIPGVHVVNSTHIVNGTLNVNETVQLAEMAAARFANMPQMKKSSPQNDFEQADRQPLAGCRQ
jgi:protoporphyrinogen oxidase